MFNLLEEPWIPCLLPDGGVREVGIKEALLNAGAYAELRDPSPLATAALHRLLLAVLHRSLDGPQNLGAWMATWKPGFFPENRIKAYLDKWKNRFDLFDEKHPFYQIGGFELDDTRAVTQLAQEFAGGHNPTLFDHTYELATNSWSPAVCARWLVANQAFALGFGRGPTSKMYGAHGNFLDAPLVRGAIVLLRGVNLFQTLMLNLLIFNQHQPFEPSGGLAKDIPSWERDKPVEKPGVRVCRGWLDLLTWQSRCIRLIPEKDLVRFMYYAQGDRLEQASRPNDPMWFYRLDNDNNEKAIGLHSDRSLWRSSDNLFVFSVHTDKGQETRPKAFSQALRLQEEYEILGGKDCWRCSMFGLATAPKKAASVVLWAHEEFPVPVRLLKDDMMVSALRHGLSSSEDAGRSLRSSLMMFAGKLLAFDPTQTGRSANDKMAGKKADSLQGLSYYWAALELPFKEFLSGLGGSSDPDPSLARWRKTVRHTALNAFRWAADNSLGRSARELKARVEAERFLNRLLFEVNLGVEAVEEVKYG